MQGWRRDLCFSEPARLAGTYLQTSEVLRAFAGRPASYAHGCLVPLIVVVFREPLCLAEGGRTANSCRSASQAMRHKGSRTVVTCRGGTLTRNRPIPAPKSDRKHVRVPRPWTECGRTANSCRSASQAGRQGDTRGREPP